MAGLLGLGLLLGAACSEANGGEPTSTPTQPPGSEQPAPAMPTQELPNPADERIEQPAQIVSADLRVAESAPPQYFVEVVSAQPDGCHEFARYEVTRDGDTVRIEVLNTLPEDLSVVLCLAIYGETTSNIALGSDFESGATYTLDVNGETQTFVAQ